MGRAFVGAFLALLLGCTSETECDKSAQSCPKGTYSPGSQGCIPIGHTLCDEQSQCGPDGSGSGTGLPCRPNPNGSCTYGGSTVPSRYCCGNGGLLGSLDCPANQTYDGEPGIFCGLACQRPGSQCCNSGRCGTLGGVCAPPAPTCEPGHTALTCGGATQCCFDGFVCCAPTTFCGPPSLCQ